MYLAQDFRRVNHLKRHDDQYAVCTSTHTWPSWASYLYILSQRFQLVLFTVLFVVLSLVFQLTFAALQG